MQINKNDVGANMLNKIGELITQYDNVKIMKIYSGHIAIVSKDCECDEFIMSLARCTYIVYAPEYDLYLYI
ncbi:hypothetical protein BKX95_00200 [Streptococcus iniae]|nr:hypothetical protein BKX95_00200 [Streptococcus iniae]